MISDINTLDLVLISIIAISSLLGYFKGIARQVIYTISWLASGYLAHLYGPAVSQVLPFKLPIAIAQVVAGYSVVFFSVMIAGRILGFAVSGLLKMAGLKLVDQSIGLIYGLLRGLVISLLIVHGAMAFSSHRKESSIVDESLMAPYFLEVTAWLKEELDVSKVFNRH